MTTAAARDRAMGILGARLLHLERKGFVVIGRAAPTVMGSDALGPLCGGKVRQLMAAGIDLQLAGGPRATLDALGELLAP